MTRCQWDKQWAPHPALPPCLITHCVEPFTIPAETNLEAETEEWTEINSYKQYRCRGQSYWAADRTRTTFQLLCKPDGYYLWSAWPTCLEDVECEPEPPAAPTHTEYTRPEDDGTVEAASLSYPALTPALVILNSTHNSSVLPRNYLANLTYECGAARQFLLEDGSHAPSHTLTCHWDRAWQPGPELLGCDWVSCLQPPRPPPGTNLRVTDWDGEPVQFGATVRWARRCGLLCFLIF